MTAPTSYTDTRDVRTIPTVTATTRGDRYIGSTPAGEHVYVELSITHHPPQYTTTGELVKRETVDHRTVTSYQELTASGTTRSSRYGSESAGQIIGTLEEIDLATLTITPEELRDLQRVWKSAHLNGMNAACVHQQNINHIQDYREWKAAAAEQTARCPRGYAYGSKWLVRALTNEELATARRLIARIASNPRYPALPKR
jgi:hypothetical protein